MRLTTETISHEDAIALCELLAREHIVPCEYIADLPPAVECMFDTSCGKCRAEHLPEILAEYKRRKESESCSQ